MRGVEGVAHLSNTWHRVFDTIYTPKNITCVTARDQPFIPWELIFCLIQYIQMSENMPCCKQ